jgi:hypothetical protein
MLLQRTSAQQAVVNASTPDLCPYQVLICLKTSGYAIREPLEGEVRVWEFQETKLEKTLMRLCAQSAEA